MVKKTIKANPNIKDWAKLPPGIVISLYISPKFLDKSKYRSYVKNFKKKLSKVKMKMAQKRAKSLPQGFKASAFYMASYGQFNQSDPNFAEVTFQQNSPYSFGAAFSYYPKGKLYSFASSLYYSYLFASKTNAAQSDYVRIPGEYGANFYGEYRILKYSTVAYGGIDYEQFSSFNLPRIADSGEVKIDSNSIVYATIGASRGLTLFKRNFFD